MISSHAEAEISESTGLRHAPVEADAARPILVSGTMAKTIARVAHVSFIVAAAAFFGLHFLHLGADFPNHSPWMDWSKYTDEGWYGDAAIRHMQRGAWYVPGDFNPGIALPVWPALEFLVFKAVGVSLAAARALTVSVFGGILLAGYFLLRRCAARWGTPRESLAPAAATLLLAVSPFCYVFTRLAILEPLLILLGLVALLVASYAGRGGTWMRRWGPAIGLGVIVPLMVLTKTTAVFLLPSIAWMLWAATGYRLREFLRLGVATAAIAAGLWSAYFAFIVRPHYLDDYRYLFSANAYTGMTRANAWSVIATTVRDGMWMGKIIYPLELLAVLVALAGFRRYCRNPVVPSLILWAGGYAGFLSYHNNLQPRYYLVIAVALALLVPLVAEESLRGLSFAKITLRPLGALTAVAAMIAVVSMDARQTVEYMKTPVYGFQQVARELRDVVRADKNHNPLVLSISGSDISLMTGLPSICDDFGTMTLQDRVAAYRPGWYATWNEVDDDKMDALSPTFHLERVAAFPVFDDPERNLLILYRLDPPQAEVPRKQRRKTVPKLLQTKMGQQPSAMQLEH